MLGVVIDVVNSLNALALQMSKGLCNRMIMQMMKDAVSRRLVFSVQNDRTFNPVIVLPLSLYFIELRRFILEGEVKIYACPASKGIEISCWNDLEKSCPGIFYKLEKGEDLAIIAPVLNVTESSRIGFPIKMMGAGKVETFFPIKSTHNNMARQDEVVNSPFDLGRKLCGEILVVEITDVKFSPVCFKSGNTGKVSISGTWTKFTKLGYIAWGGRPG